jgi:hypothetical protein
MTDRTQSGSPRDRVDELSVPSGQHICLLYQDDAERFSTLARFFAAGLRENRKLLYIVDRRSPDDLRAEFAALGVDLRDRAEVRTTEDAYYPAPGRRFEPEAMCGSLDEFCRVATAEGFAGCRCTGEMNWASRDIPGADRLIEYEASLTEVIERNPFSGICQYDVRLFDGRTLLDLIEVHPYLLVRGQVLRNPNHVRARDLLGAPRPRRPLHARASW